MKLTPAQKAFLIVLAKSNDYATWLDDKTWSVGADKITITRAEVHELEKHGLVGNYSRFNPSVILDDWWSSRITEAGRERLKDEEKTNPERTH
jgi:hypothetical protein